MSTVPTGMPVHLNVHLMERRLTNGDTTVHLIADMFDPDNVVWSVTDGTVNYLTKKNEWKEAPSAMDGPTHRKFIAAHAWDRQTAEQKAIDFLGGEPIAWDQLFLATPFDLNHSRTVQFSTLVHREEPSNEDNSVFRVTTYGWHLILRDGSLSPRYIWDLDYEKEEPHVYRVNFEEALSISSNYIANINLYKETIYTVLMDS